MTVSTSDVRAVAAAAPDWGALRDVASGCTACELHRTRTQVVFASGTAPCDVMFVGEAPGEDEDETGVPFVGRSGQLLDRLLSDAGLARDAVVVANVVKCRPPGNRDPLPVEVERCKPWLRRQVHLADPAVVCTLGSFATRWALGPRVSITRVRGQRFTVSGRAVVPTFHPAAALRSGPNGSRMHALRADIALLARVARERAAAAR